MKELRWRRPARRRVRRAVLLALAALAALAAAGAGLGWADAPPVFAIQGARLYPVAGPPVEGGTLVVRDGLIEAVGVGIPVPADARVIDGKGLSVYPGLIDATSDIGLAGASTAAPAASPGGQGRGAAPATPAPAPPAPATPPAAPGETMNPQARAADGLTDGGARAEAARAAGITTVLLVPAAGIFRGQSALVNLNGDPKTMVVRSPVAQHLRLSPGGGARQYPGSLMGVIAYVRQAFLDTRRYDECWRTYNRSPRGLPRPETDRALEALLPAARKELPVVVPAASVPEIRRALQLEQENDLRLILAGAGEGWKVAPLLKERAVPVLVSLRFPERRAPTEGGRGGNPDAEESLRTLQARADAPKNAGELRKAGVPFAFFSDGLSPRDFLRAVGKAVKAGLPPEAALRALTLSAAEICGAQEQLGSLEPGKIANLVVAEGDLFGDQPRVRDVFVDGKRFPVPPAQSTAETPRTPRGEMGQDEADDPH